MSAEIVFHVDRVVPGQPLRGLAWAEDATLNPFQLDVRIDDAEAGQVDCALFRPDAGQKGARDPYCGFEYYPPFYVFDDQPHSIRLSTLNGTGESKTLDGVIFKSLKTYDDFESFLCWSYFFREFYKPFSEADKRVLAYMDWYADYLAAEEVPATATRAFGPLVSVIMPVFNREHSVGPAIGSVLAQSYPHFELILIDDGSRDRSVEVCRRYDDRRVRLIERSENGGVSRARNDGLAAAKGTYIAYLDSDNVWDPRFLAVMVRALVSADRRLGYCGQYLTKQSLDTVIGVRFGPFNPSLLRNRNFIDLNAFVHHRAFFESEGGFAEDMRRLVDWELIARYAEAEWPLAVPAVLSRYLYNQQPGTITISEDVEAAKASLNERLYGRIARTFHYARGKRSIPVHLVENGAPKRKTAPQVGRAIPRSAGVTVVIPSFFVPDILAECVRSVLEGGVAALEIIIVDNRSDARTQERLRQLAETHESVRVHFNDANEGFTAAVNRGIGMASQTYDVVIMNNDAVGVGPWLADLQTAMDEHREFGMLAPQQILPPNTETMQSHQPFCNPNHDIDVNVSLHHGNLLGGILSSSYERSRILEVSFVPFFCVYVRRAIIDRIGLLDERRGRHYRSDRLYCNAIRHVARKRVGVAYAAKAYHLLQQSSEALRQERTAEYEEIAVGNVWREPERRFLWDEP